MAQSPTDDRQLLPKSSELPLSWGRDDSAKKLNLYQQVLTENLRIEAGWLPGLVPWHWKQRVGEFIWRDAQQIQALRNRLLELRYPLNRFEKDAKVASLVRESANVSEDTPWVAGVFLELKTLLRRAVARHIQLTLEVADRPSVQILQDLVRELDEQIQWANSAIDARSAPETDTRRISDWRSYLRARLLPLFENELNSQEQASIKTPDFRRQFEPFAQAKRGDDVQVGDPSELLVKYNHPSVPDVVITEFRNYSQEMMAAETLGSIIYEVQNMPWDYYFDSARHLYDEVRHSNLGVDRLRDFGISLRDVPQTHFHYGQRMKLSPLERYAVLTMVIEAPSFPDMQARQKTHLERGDLKSAEYVGYDIVDETMHVRFGNKWLPVMMERAGEKRSLETFVAYCAELWKELTPNYSDMVATVSGRSFWQQTENSHKGS